MQKQCSGGFPAVLQPPTEMTTFVDLVKTSGGGAGSGFLNIKYLDTFKGELAWTLESWNICPASFQDVPSAAYVDQPVASANEAELTRKPARTSRTKLMPGVRRPEKEERRRRLEKKSGLISCLRSS